MEPPSPATPHPLAFFGFEKVAYFRRVAEAAIREARNHPGLRFQIFEHQPEDMFAYADKPEVHGVIAPILKPEHLEHFLRRRTRVILFSSRLSESDLPPDVGWIHADDAAIGAGDLRFAHLREQGFHAAWESQSTPRGHYCACLQGNAALGDFLTTLPRPCGIFCSDDSHAKSLVTAGIHCDESAPFYHSADPIVIVARALQWIEQHLDQPVHIDKLARHCAASRRNLEYLFKKHLGKGPYQQLLHMRLHLAKRLLRHSRKSISDIADTCGFTSPREFSVRFKEKIGQTPSQYREGE